MASPRTTITTTVFFFSSSLLSLLPLLISPAAAADLTPYEALEGFNFPTGLLPIGATGYELDESTGNFKAYLNGSCRFRLEDSSYDLSYEPTISGAISKNRLTGLKGISVKVYFLWLSIVEVSRRGEALDFSVGFTSASFPVENFEESPQCGCGLDCGGRRTDEGSSFLYSI